MESAIARFHKDIHYNVLVNFSLIFLHSYSDVFSYVTLCRIHLQTLHQVFNVLLEDICIV
jgi:hypothetical protein